MFTLIVEILQNIIDNAIDGEHRAEAESAYDGLTSFEFVFILHLEKETMEIIDKLCQAKPISRHFKCHAFSFIY